ncbi:MAG: arylsulfatase [Bryobacteraceae bacterium]
MLESTILSRRQLLAAALATGSAHAAPALPNMVFILADDLGMGDLSCYNRDSKILTPNLDRLAAQGMRFNDAHTPSSVCTPTRYGLLTGRYCWRSRLTEGVLDGFDPPLIEKGRLTAASLLKRHRYTTACIGKWHLGMQWTTRDGTPVVRRTEPGFRAGMDVDYSRPITGGPKDAGFDSYFGISASLDMSPYCFIENDRTVGTPDVKTEDDRSLFMNQVPGVRTKDFHLEDVIPTCRRKAVEFIGRQKGAAKPFFLYMPLSSPHLPIVPNREFDGRSKAGKYGDFVVEMDEAVGAVLGALDAADVADRTLVLFSSDNGALWHWWNFQEADDKALGKITPRGEYLKSFGHQSNAWMRGTKADTWEGGHHVPLLARWPGRIKAGAVSDSLVCLTDFVATCADIVHEPLPSDAAEDSFNLMPVLLDAKRSCNGPRSLPATLSNSDRSSSHGLSLI